MATVKMMKLKKITLMKNYRNKVKGRRMKNFISLIMIFALTFSLCSCKGKVSNVKVIDKGSEIYSKEDISSAINIIKKEFHDNWDGCTLKEISYAGDDFIPENQEFADRNNADEVIVLTSSFYVDETGGDGSLDPNSTYDHWQWILVRNKDGQWKYVDHGY